MKSEEEYTVPYTGMQLVRLEEQIRADERAKIRAWAEKAGHNLNGNPPSIWLDDLLAKLDYVEKEDG